MQFEVFSRHNARNFSFHQNIPDCIIISITDVDAGFNRFASNPHIKGICHIKFDDVDFGDTNCISEKDGQKIIQFVNNYINSVEKIVVHCEAGVSRSAGICAALMKIINGSDVQIFNNARFRPNMTCYRIVIEAFYGSYSKDPIDINFRKNILEFQQKHLGMGDSR